MFHLYGRWVAAEGPIAEAFLRELARMVAEWDEKLEGVDVLIGKERSRPGEVTSFQDGAINVLMRP